MGRDPSSAIYLESDYVSNEHARLHLSATGIEIEDLNSTSGTYLDGITVRGKLDIQPGQKIQIGDLQVDLTMEGAGEVAAAATLGAGRYTLVQELGRGAMGTVWLATDNELQEEVAIKLLAPELAGDAVTLADLKREVQKSRRLSHEHIIRIHDLSNLPGELPFITMEFIRGSNMDAVRLNQPDGLMSWKHLRSVAVQLAEALDYAHRQKIVHRDLKPANMMVTEDYTLKLADFGIAATLNDSTARSSLAGTVSGTLTYMSPQQLQGEDPRGSDDIYSLGATLYNLIAGRPPFKSGDVRGQILNQSPTPLTQVLASAGVQSDIPDYVSSLVMACLAKDPEDRPQSGKAIVEWIVSEGKSELIVGKETSIFKAIAPAAAAAAPPKPPPPGGGAKRNKKLVIGIATAAIVAVLAVAGILLLDKGEGNAATQEPGTLLWSFETGDEVTSSPAIGPDDTVYVGSKDHKVYALDGKTGAIKWEYTSKTKIGAPPAIGSDGTVYIGTGLTGAELLALEGTTGEKKWAFRVGQGIPSAPAIGADGTLYFGSKTQKVYAVNADGTKKWEFETGGAIYSSPAIGADGTVYIGSGDNKLYALDGTTGTNKWEFTTGGRIPSSPAIHPGGRVFFGSTDGKVYAFSAYGERRWYSVTGGQVHSSPVIGSPHGTIYIGSNDGKVYALSWGNGAKKWEFEAGKGVRSTPAIGSDGTLYVGSMDGKIYALDGATGIKKWEYETGGEVYSSPAIGPNGTVYVGSNDGKIYALASGSKGLAKSAWPMRGRNAAHSGRMSVMWSSLSPDIARLKADANDGDFLAQNSLGDIYRVGKWAQANDTEALSWYRKSAEAGFHIAQWHLGNRYINGEGAPVDNVKGMEWLKKAADHEHPNSIYQIGWMLQTGTYDGIEQDRVEALKWYHKAAKHNHPKSLNQIGHFYRSGWGGLEQDYNQAIIWFNKSADLGNDRAIFNLGHMYEIGQGRKDLKKAAEYYGKAALMGHSGAQHALAYGLEKGWSGAPPNHVYAYAWYTIAIDNGNKKAINNRKRLEGVISPNNKNSGLQLVGQLRKQIKEK